MPMDETILKYVLCMAFASLAVTVGLHEMTLGTASLQFTPLLAAGLVIGAAYCRLLEWLSPATHLPIESELGIFLFCHAVQRNETRNVRELSSCVHLAKHLNTSHRVTMFQSAMKVSLPSVLRW